MADASRENMERRLKEYEVMKRYLRPQNPERKDALPPARRAAVLQFPHGYSRLAAFFAKRVARELFALMLEHTAGDPMGWAGEIARIEECRAEMEQMDQRVRQSRPARRPGSGGK